MRLETARLLLVPPQFTDATDLARSVRESLRELSPWFPWATNEYNLRHAQEFIAKVTKDATDKRALTFAIKRKDGHFVGLVDLRHKPDHLGQTIPAFEIGYWLRTADTRNGYATEAVQRLARSGFEELAARRIDIRCHSGNSASARVAEKSGFTLEARLKHTSKNPDDTLADTLVFAQIK